MLKRPNINTHRLLIRTDTYVYICLVKGLWNGEIVSIVPCVKASFLLTDNFHKRPGFCITHRVFSFAATQQRVVQRVLPPHIMSTLDIVCRLVPTLPHWKYVTGKACNDQASYMHKRYTVPLRCTIVSTLTIFEDFYRIYHLVQVFCLNFFFSLI